MKRIFALFLNLSFGVLLLGQAGRVKPLPKVFELDSISQIINGKYTDGAIIKVKGSNGTLPCEYLVQASYSDPVDSLNVIPVPNGFAVIRPVEGKINVGWYTIPGDTLNNFLAFQKTGDYLQYSDEANTLFVPPTDVPFDLRYAFYPPYGNTLRVYGNLKGAGRNSSKITATNVDSFITTTNLMFRIENEYAEVSGLQFSLYGDPLQDEATKSATLVGLNNIGITVKDNWFKECTVGSGNTAGNHYVTQFTPQNNTQYSTILLDTLLPGENVDARVVESDFIGRNQPVVLFDATTGNSDTTYIEAEWHQSDSLRFFRITDTIPAGAAVTTYGHGRSRTKLLNNVFENMQIGTAVGINSSEVLIHGNTFRNNGLFNTHHDMYNQAGLQIITDNWFEGGSGYACNDANKQNFRLSGGRIFSGNTFYNKNLCIQFVPQSNPVTWYSLDPPVSPLYGNRVYNAGEVIVGNTFYSNSGNPQYSAVQFGSAFGGIDPNTPLLGNATMVFANNNLIGRAQFGGNSDYVDLIFEGNVFELSDTASIVDPIIQLPDSAQVLDNTIISRGPDHFFISGNKLRVDNLKFKQAQVITLNEQNVRFNDSWVTDSEFVITDTIFNAGQSTNVQFVSMSGGAWKDNVFSLEGSSETRNIVNLGNGDFLPIMEGNRFYNTGMAVAAQGKHDENFKNGGYLRNNPGMRLWNRGQFGYPFGGVEQTENSGNIIFAEAHTFTGTDPQGGDLIVVNPDSTYDIATYTDDLTGVLMMGARLDSIYAYSQLFEGQIIRINSTNAAQLGDYLVMDTITAGKIKSQGLVRPSSDHNLIVQALEDAPEWDSGATYSVGDLVHYQNRNYLCTYANSNQAPSTSQFTLEPYWTGRPLKVQVIHHGLISSEDIFQAVTYSLFPAITYTPTDSIPVDTTLNSYPITARIDGDTLRQITYSVTKAPTINLDLRVLIWDGSSYTAAFSGTVPAGQRIVTVSGAIAVATDQRIFPEILTDSGASGLDLELKFQKP